MQHISRPGVLSLAIKELAALQAAYMPYIQGGGLFIPSTRTYRLGDEVFMLLTLPEGTNKLPAAGKVVWITPVGCHGGKLPGIGVQFADTEASINVRTQIERLLSGTSNLSPQSHTI